MHKIFRLLLVLIVLLPFCEATRSALATTITIGETTVLSTADGGNGNLLAAQNATLSQPAIIQSLSFYVTQASGNLVLGIYDASGPNGGPGALKAQTKRFTPVVGWNTANVITPVSLPAGTYWLAYLPSSNSLAFMKGLTSGVSIQYYSYPFGALPATFSTSSSADPYHWSFYATLNPAPTISSISLSKSSFAAGAPSGTVVGTISVNMSSGSFTGSLSLSGANASDFKIVGSNLETNAVLPPGPYNINIIATQNGAANSPFTQTETITAAQSISSVSLSNGSFLGGSPSGTIVGAINVTMSPSSPAFSGSLSLSTTQGGCTATNGANNSSFAISGRKLVTNGTVPPGTYAVCILATQAGATNSPFGRALTITASSQATASLSANPTSISSGQSSTLTWSSTNAASCIGTNFSTGNATSGSTSVSPTSTTTYTVTCATAQASATVTVGGPQTATAINIGSNGCSGAACNWPNIDTAMPTGNYIGTLSTTVSGSPPFSGSYSLVGTDSSGNCTAFDTTDFTVSGDQLQLANPSSPPTRATYNVCVKATASANTLTKQFTVKVAHVIDAAASYCAANGGGDGTSGNPWHSACINAAVAAATSGDTIFLAAGNWELNTTEAPVVVTKALNFVGVGSGNTFDAMGHPNNAGPSNLTATPGGSITAIRSSGPNANPLTNDCVTLPGGYIWLEGTNDNMSHIYFDGTTGSTGLSACALPTYNSNTGPGVLDDVRARQMADGSYGPSSEGRISANNAQSVTVKNSIIVNPVDTQNNGNCTNAAFQMSAVTGVTISNVYLYQTTLNPIATEGLNMNGTVIFAQNDANCNSSIGPVTTMGWSGTGMGPASTSSAGDGLGDGVYHFNISNNVFFTAGEYFGTGGAINDPTTNGSISDLNYTGNWLIGANVAIDSCDHHAYDPGHWTTSFNTNYFACAPRDPDGGGMQVNATWQPWLNCSNASTSDAPNRENPSSTNGISYGFNSTNNSLIGTTGGGVNGAAQLVASGTGIVPCHQTSGGTPISHIGTMVNYRAHQNYLSSPANRYISDADTINPSVTGNFCAGGGGTFTQTDSTTCATTGFTTPPTASFTLGQLGAGGVVPFTATNFTAQYGAVKWIASTSSTTPTSGDSRWSYIPPFSLSAAHGNTVYLWVMDSANHISAPASALIP